MAVALEDKSLLQIRTERLHRMEDERAERLSNEAS